MEWAERRRHLGFFGVQNGRLMMKVHLIFVSLFSRSRQQTLIKDMKWLEW